MRKRPFRFFWIFVVFAVSISIQAKAESSETSIRGKVTDLATGNPIVNVHIQFEGGETHTDSKGNYFQDNVDPAFYTLVFSKLNYETIKKDIYIYGDTVLDIQMSPECVLSIITLSLLPASVEQYYNEAIDTNCNTRPFTYSIIDGLLPAGLEIDELYGNISGTPIEVGSTTFTVKVIDIKNNDAQRTFTMNVTDTIEFLSPQVLPRATQWYSYHYQFLVKNGVEPFEFNIINGSLPNGMYLSFNGVIGDGSAFNEEFDAPLGSNWVLSGDVAPFITDDHRIQFGDITNDQFSEISIAWNMDNNSSIQFDYEVSSEHNPTSSRYDRLIFSIDGTVISRWSGVKHDTFTMSNISSGRHVFSWQYVKDSTASAGADTAWIDNIIIPGTESLPSQIGPSNFEIEVIDAEGRKGQKEFTIEVVEPLIAEQLTLKHGIVGEEYNQIFKATGGYGGYTWDIYSGIPPNGLNLYNNHFHGFPTEPTYGTIVFSVVDEEGRIDFVDTTIHIIKPLQILMDAIPDGLVGEYYSEMVRFEGGIEPYLFQIKGILPDGFSFDPHKGIFFGTPTAALVNQIEVSLTDGTYPVSQKTDPKKLTFKITENLTILSSTVLPSAQKGQEINPVILKAGGGPTPYSWSVIEGVLPDGIELNSDTGKLFGIPLGSGDITFKIQVIDATGQSNTKVFIWHISDDLVLVSGILPSSVKNIPYIYTLKAKGGFPPYVWRIKSGALLSGLSFNKTTGTIEGIPTQSGEIRQCTIEVSDSDTPSQTKSKTFTMNVINNDLYIFTSELPNAIVSQPYKETIRASLGQPPYQWRYKSGEMPAGLDLKTTPSVAYLEGTPNTPGRYHFVISVCDNDTPQKSVEKEYTIEIYGGLDVETNTLKKACQYEFYNDAIKVSNGTLPYFWKLTGGSLAGSGLNLDQHSGTIYGKSFLNPGQHAEIDVTISDSGNPANIVEKTYDIYGMNCSLEIEPSPSDFPRALQKHFFQKPFQGKNGMAPYSWSISSGKIPDGMELDKETGIFYGIPAQCGFFKFVLNMEDSSSGGAVQAYQFKVVCCNNCYEISGFIKEMDNPVADVNVFLKGDASEIATTDIEGFYIFEGLSNGNYSVSAAKAGYTFTPDNYSLTIEKQDIHENNFSAKCESRPPYKPSNPMPEDNSENISLDIHLTWTGGDEDIKDSVTYEVYLYPGSLEANPQFFIDLNETQLSLQDLEANQVYYWKVIATDNHAIQTTGDIWKFTTIEPDLENPDPPTQIHTLNCSVKTWTNNRILELSWEPAVDSQSGIGGYSYIWDKVASTIPDDSIDTASTIINSPDLTDGNNHYFHIRSVDNAGNASITKHLGPFYIDTTPPQNVRLLINDNENETNSIQVILTTEATDKGAGLDKMIFSNDDIYWSSPEIYTYSYNGWSLTDGKGERRVLVKLSDKVGNWIEMPVYDSIVLGMPKTETPIIFSALRFTTEIVLKWHHIENADYVIYRSETEDGIFYPVTKDEYIDISEETAQYIDINLNKTKTYYYQVQAFINNVASERSSVVGINSDSTLPFNIQIISPYQMVQQNDTINYYVLISSETNYDGNINVSCSGIDSDLSYRFFREDIDVGTALTNVKIPLFVTLKIETSELTKIENKQFTLSITADDGSFKVDKQLFLYVIQWNSSGIYTQLNKQNIRMGESCLISGKIQPQLTNDTIHLEIKNQITNEIIKTKDVITNENGEYSDMELISTLFPGFYTLEARFTDNDSTIKISNNIPFQIRKGEPKLNLLQSPFFNVETNKPYMLSGILEPAIDNVSITICVESPQNQKDYFYVTTDEQGMFETTQTFFKNSGIWKFKAYWNGNSYFIGCESSYLSIPVELESNHLIILGGSHYLENGIDWKITEQFTVNTYFQFKSKGYSDEMISLMVNSPGFDPLPDKAIDESLPTPSRFKTMLNELSMEKTSSGSTLFIFIQSKITPEGNTVLLYDDQFIRAQDFADEIDFLQEKMQCSIVIILESPYSGGLIPYLQDSRRVLLTSSDNTTYSQDISGELCFSTYLLSKLEQGYSLQKSFIYAQQIMKKIGYPLPQISDPDYIAYSIYLNANGSKIKRAEIKDVDITPLFSSETEVTAYIEPNDVQLTNVMAKIIDPGTNLLAVNTYLGFGKVSLSFNEKTGLYHGTIKNIKTSGLYKVIVTAEDNDNVITNSDVYLIGSLNNNIIMADLNNDGIVNLKDAILSLKILSGNSEQVIIQAEINNDSKIGIEESVFILKYLSNN